MREITCIACPMGCRLSVGKDDSAEVTVKNYGCKRGIAYGVAEFTCPMRTVTSSVRVQGGEKPLCSVKTKDVVPKVKIPEVLEAIRTALPQAPIRIGQVIIANVAQTGVDLVATANCIDV